MSKLQKRIDKLQVILEASKLLNSSKNTDEILKFLLKKSLELIEGGDTGVIFIYNETSKVLEAKSYIGFGNSIVNVKLLPGESMTGRVFLTQKTIFCNSEIEIKQAMENMKPENITFFEESVNCKFDTFKACGSISCPLMYKENCIGVITIDSSNDSKSLTYDDMSLLEAISVQATIAIINARNYEKELRNKEMMGKYNKLLEEERNKYQYSSNLHSKFTQMVLNHSHIGDILFEIASLLKKDVFMLDLFFNIDYYYFKYYTDLEAVTEISPDFVNRLSGTEAIQYFSHAKKLHMYFIPIIVNMDILGWLCVVSDDNNYLGLDKITIERGATILALQLLKINELNDMEQSLRGDFLDNLIENQNKKYLLKCAKNYKFHFDRPHQIIIIEMRKNEELQSRKQSDVEFKRYTKQYYNIINEAVNKAFPSSFTLIKGNNIIIVLEKSEKNNDKIKKLLDKIMYINSYNKIILKAGVSDIIRSIDYFNSAYFNTQQTIRMLNKLDGDKRYLFYEDLEIEKLLLNNIREDLENFMLKTIGQLIEYQPSSKEFLNTLKIYIQSNGNWTYTKDYLHIHGNTLSYRLKKIMELLNTDINDYKERLKIQIAFEIYDLLPLYDAKPSIAHSSD